MAHPASRYHRRVLRELAYFALLPIITTHLLLRWRSISLGALMIPAYAVAVATWITINQLRSSCVQVLEQRNLGARPIPCVNGRLPGNLDVLFRMMKAFKSSYVLDVYLQLFKEYNTTTLNLRILWVDNVSGPRQFQTHADKFDRSSRWIRSTRSSYWLRAFRIFGEVWHRKSACEHRRQCRFTSV